MPEKFLGDLTKLVPDQYRWVVLVFSLAAGLALLIIDVFSLSNMQLKALMPSAKRWRNILIRSFFISLFIHVYNLGCGIWFSYLVSNQNVKFIIVFLLFILSAMLFTTIFLLKMILAKRHRLNNKYAPTRKFKLFIQSTVYSFITCSWFSFMAVDTITFYIIQENRYSLVMLIMVLVLFCFPIVFFLFIEDLQNTLYLTRERKRRLMINTPIGYKYLLQVHSESLYVLGDEPHESICKHIYVYDTEKQGFKMEMKIEQQDGTN
ncbi:hypothetical protein [Paenibacillus silvisoli]|uniref:hypothetical protein n=1 Tax=Paenibacillus silvisoli TaxID=3110539 RepID=UPI0028055622|nr:hypothetical protein [Paenibacillus silvisoli]